MLLVTRAMSDESRARFAALKAVQTRPVLASIVDAASCHGLWPELLQLLPVLPAAARRRVAALGTGFGRPVLAQIVGAAHGRGLWDPLLQFATELERRTQIEIAKLLAATQDAVLDDLLDAVWEQRKEPELARLAALLPAKDMSAFGDRLVARGGEEIVAATARSRRRAGPRAAQRRTRGGVSRRAAPAPGRHPTGMNTSTPVRSNAA